MLKSNLFNTSFFKKSITLKYMPISTNFFNHYFKTQTLNSVLFKEMFLSTNELFVYSGFFYLDNSIIIDNNYNLFFQFSIFLKTRFRLFLFNFF